MKYLFVTAALLFSMIAFAQVGINNNSPKATLDITAKTSGTKPEGLIIPQLSGNNIHTATAAGIYGANQIGLIVYASAADTNPTGPTANITTAGYYYFDGNAWQKMAGASSGDTTNDAWINDTNNGLVKLGAKADGTARAAGSDFIAKDNGQVGIGTSSPDASAALDVTSTNKGFLPPRVALNSKTDTSTISSPTAGLLVYNTGTGTLKSSGMYYWDGSQWTSLKGDGGASSATDLNIGETRTAVITVPTSSFVTNSTISLYRTWMNGRAINNTQSVNYKLLSDAAGNTAGFVNFGPNGALRMDFSSGGYAGCCVAPKFVNTSSSPIFYSLNALSTYDANLSWGTGMWLAAGAVCKQIDGNDGFGYATNDGSEYVNANILIHNTTDGSVQFYIGTWSLMSANDGLGHNNTYGLFTITRYK
ncbi:hypothetical protein SAMN05421856_104280 [Chryseobacterium taichungense]|uniref:C1q domain-containing protein n=1 Tax=Chryseobacterium taichungense TaxID=295069 RepID=A0A1H7ZHJ1_9FLAO|nr:hypothetical protein [Chryseobacterium taichungense]SEM57723.1 hypothetical protein SAMN05421856_104280 [Chryseobacterium taichungense]